MQSSQMFPLKADTDQQIEFLANILDFDARKNKITLKKLTGGITNAVFKLNVNSKKYIVRIYGNNTDEIIDRKREQEHISTINLITIYATFGNGMIVSYVEGRSIDLPMMSDPAISPRIAKAIAKFHKATYFKDGFGQINHQNEIFSNIKIFLQGLKPDFIHKKTGQKIDIGFLEKTFISLQDELSDLMKDSKICLCHNDLLSGNFLWDGDNEVNVCDYEYSSYTWPEFDIANHFFEYCGFQCDLSRFPSTKNQRNFVINYLSELYGVSNEEILKNEKYIKMIDNWLKKINLLVKLSNFFWGAWAYFQAINSDVDFPYFEYAQTRIKLMDYQFPLIKNEPMLIGPLVSINQ
ncbi:Ethanolamine kinase [Tritrichomonas musculus]|uniref:ethanolamine kinase n=1 Tax=Tritrichomonas musculus TaxID=1915356 RepID=A0ABR2GS80_9EUKA